ncbi:flagellar assembly protein FliH [Nitrosomonas sp.]|uniref:flagellar assembly protein FliH n=1 Tax=Nitrosomonas sp. TaxID=42353 RepID=UPI0025F11A5B|nr:flagellar assembly protein FliH [Nitrosomonas sp.]MCC6916482.1 flagellar assembly protein FliH [Nitrosomonas sp.]
MEAAHVIPKKELSTWQKWEFGTLDSLKPRQRSIFPEKTASATGSQNPSATPIQTVQKTAEQDPVVLPTAEQIEQIYQQAYEEGKTTGYQEGRAQAEDEIQVEILQLQSLITRIEQELTQVDQTMAQDLLTLAIDLARKITGQALTVKPELIVPVVEDALRQLPAVSQPVRLTLHPDDAARIRNHLENHTAHPKWHIHEDNQIEPGGCRIESGGCEVDATLATRWQRTLASIGQDSPWLI